MSRATLIISVYDNTTFLKVVLDSVMRQTCRDFDIIVSEDAEHPHMNDFLAAYPFSLPWQHLSQPDQGWQKNKALNRAIQAAKSNYLIFIDGDCVLHPRFVEQHLAHAKEGCILGGKRIKLNEALTDMFLKSLPPAGFMNRHLFNHLFNAKKTGLRFAEEGLYLSPAVYPGLLPALRPMHQLKGCNMSFHKDAILAINGFDEDYTRPAIGEDIDLTWRFQLAGYKLHSVRNVAVQYHLYHTENWIDQSENMLLMAEKQKKGKPWCNNGLQKTEPANHPENPLLSIILCTYNGQSYLKDQLDSLLQQTYPHFEVIAIDDHSTDSTFEELKKIAGVDTRFVVMQNATTMGINKNFEKGIQLSKGDYILICDQDDSWETNKLECLLSHLNGSTLYFHNSRLINEKGESLGLSTADKYNMRSNMHPLSFLMLNAVSGHTCMFPKSLLSHNLLPFPDDIYYDNWLAYIAALHGKTTYINDCLVNYRIHGKNNAASKIKKHHLDAQLVDACRRQLRYFADRTPDTVPFRDWLIQLSNTYQSNNLYMRLRRVFLLLKYVKQLTAVRKKNAVHRFALCLKMGYKPLPNLFQRF